MMIFGNSTGRQHRHRWGKGSPSHHRQRDGRDSQPGDPLTLADIPSGRQAYVKGFDERIPADRRAHLQSYGMVPGYAVLVLQHSPVMVVRIENLELALETDLARMVQVSV